MIVARSNHETIIHITVSGSNTTACHVCSCFADFVKGKNRDEVRFKVFQKILIEANKEKDLSRTPENV